jgi:hypothetical protein
MGETECATESRQQWPGRSYWRVFWVSVEESMWPVWRTEILPGASNRANQDKHRAKRALRCDNAELLVCDRRGFVDRRLVKFRRIEFTGFDASKTGETERISWDFVTLLHPNSFLLRCLNLQVQSGNA